MAVFIKKVNIPQKSDLINIDMTGSGTAQTYRVLKNVGGRVVEVVGMTPAGTGKYGSNNTYNGSDVDVVLNTTWYNTLSNDAKLAIVDKVIVQYMYEYNNGAYNSNTYASYATNKSVKESDLTRHIYLLGVDQINDYFSNTFSQTQLFDLLLSMWSTCSLFNGFGIKAIATSLCTAKCFFLPFTLIDSRQ